MHRSCRPPNLLLIVCLFVSTVLSLSSSRLTAQVHDDVSLGRRLAAIAREHPQRVTVRSIATTRGKRDVWLATIGTTNADSRPAVLVVGGVDGSRMAGSELALRFIEMIARDASDSVRELLSNTTFYVIARANPDAAGAYFARPRYEPAGNSTPYDDDRDGALDEDGYEDLNGDGMITQMRVETSRGRFYADPDDARVMREADASRGERGSYELLTEGRDNDKDGTVNDDPPGGVDINRNFPFNYKAFGSAAGEHAASEIETRAIADFCYDHQNIAAVFSFSPQANLLHPWEARSGETPSGPGRRIVRSVREGDVVYLDRLAKIYTDITGLKRGPAYVKGEGSFAEWAYYHYGRLSVSTLGWFMTIAGKDAAADTSASDSTSVKRADTVSDSTRKRKGDRDKSAVLDSVAWLERNGGESALVAWTRYEHPDYPGRVVEIGGVTPYALSEPPASMLDSLGKRNGAFILRLGGLLQRIVIADVRTELLGEGLTRIRVSVVNNGYLPTLASMGETSRVPIDVKAELTLGNGQSIITGRRVQLLGPIDGSGGSKELTWVVAGRGTVVVSVKGPMAGGAEQSVTLGR